jgi:CBS domain-containing protein
MEEKIRIGDVMTKKVVTIGPEENIQSAAKKMKANKIGCIVVTRGDDLLGVVTERDVVWNHVADNKGSKVTDIMSKPAITVGPEMDILDAAKIMKKRDIKKLPVLSNDKLVGIITDTDIMKLSPAVCDILVEAAKIKFAAQGEDEAEEGVCDECGKESDFLKLSNGKLLCENCFE